MTTDVAYLTRALKMPRVRQVAASLADTARDEGWDYTEFLAKVLSEEVASRETHGGENRVKAARFPQTKTLDDFDFTHQRSVSRQQIAHLHQLDFLREAHNVIFLGPPGTGKTHLSIALGVQAARRGYRVAVRLRNRMGHPPRRRPTGRPAHRRARTPRTHPAAHRRRGRLHPVRPRRCIPVLPARLIPLRTELTHRVLEQDILRLG